MTTETKDPYPTKGAILAWSLYDWANSAFFTIIITFVFATYVSNSVATTIETGTAAWGTTISISALAIAIMAPILGAIADRKGGLKRWIGLFTAVCICATAGLWFVEPNAEFLMLALILVAISNFAAEFGIVFYNALMPGLVSEAKLGRISGWAWGLGYAGGLLCLVFALLVLVLPENAPFGLDRSASEHVRATAILVAIWFAVFSLPIFIFTPDRTAKGITNAEAIREGLSSLMKTLRHFSSLGGIGRFLIARMIYIDGINTLFAFGGIYAAGTFGMDFQEILFFGILLNVTAGLGAASFAWIDDWIGAKKTIVISLVALTLLGGAGVLVESKIAFYIVGAALGIFVGPVQASSRTLMAKLASPNTHAEMFGLYALSGKVTAFVGPALVGWVTFFAGSQGIDDSQRWGMATLLIFLVIGLLVLLPLKEPKTN